MTDITELAQRMKAAAEKASNGDWVKESGDGWEACCSANDQANGGFIIAHFEGPDAAENREFVQAANPANILALVEALEKAQRANEYLREQSAEWERKAISNFEDCAELSARVEELESQRKLAFTASNRWADKFRAAEKRIADLESRTVKLPDLRQIVSGDRYVWSDGVYNYSQDVKVALAAAGIKVEAE
ncbi:TPA: ead/Ea22-like family protein [Klebsiella pneumoniae]|nr:ead/Ea22-like family protein [Klebsiella pneumoniae]